MPTNIRQFTDKGLVRRTRKNLGSGAFRRVRRSKSSKFGQLVAYFAALYADGEISKTDFEIVVNYASTAFVGQEVENKVERLVAERLQGLFN